MFSSNMFDGMISMLIGVGLVAGLIVFGLPGYFIGRSNGKIAVYEEVMKRGLLEIRYDQQTGEKIYIWVQPPKKESHELRSNMSVVPR